MVNYTYHNNGTQRFFCPPNAVYSNGGAISNDNTRCCKNDYAQSYPIWHHTVFAPADLQAHLKADLCSKLIMLALHHVYAVLMD